MLTVYLERIICGHFLHQLKQQTFGMYWIHGSGICVLCLYGLQWGCRWWTSPSADLLRGLWLTLLLDELRAEHPAVATIIESDQVKVRLDSHAAFNVLCCD